jgi:hypothetical protein
VRFFGYGTTIQSEERLREKEKRNTGRMFLGRYVLLPLATFCLTGFIYPGVALLEKWVGPDTGSRYAHCVAMPPETVGATYTAGILVLLAWAVLFRYMNNALLALLYALPWGVWMATWWFAAALGVMMCDSLPGREVIYPLTHLVLLSLAVSGAIWLHTRLPRTIEFNRQVYDFDTMQLALFVPVVRPDGATVRPKHFLYVFAFLVPAGLALIYIDSKVPKLHVGDWGGVILLTGIGYLFLLLSWGGVSTAWHVFRRSKGRRMTIKEFS